MSSIIPVEQILKGKNAQRILELFGESLSSSYISTYLEKYISNKDRSKLSKYNSNSIETDLNEDNLKKEIERLKLTKEKTDDLANLKKEYLKFSNNILEQERFDNNFPTTIIGVGVDGSGNFPLNGAQETNDMRKIEEEAQIQTKWNPSTEDGDEYLRESVKNVCLWQASNVAQLPIGSPVEVCSAVIQLLSPVSNPGSDYNQLKYDPSFTGKIFLERRREISGLQYLIRGNLLEIQNANIIIDGKKDFEKQIFTRFGLNGTSSPVQISLINGISGTQITPQKFQCENNNDDKIVNNDIIALLNPIQSNTTPSYNTQKIAVLFLFTIFFEYGCYIFNLYNEFLIKKIGKSSNEIVEYLKKANIRMFYNFILLINYSLIRKFKIKNNSDEYYDPNDFIFIDEAINTGDELTYDKNFIKGIAKIGRRIFPNEIKKSKDSKNNIRIFFKKELYTESEWNVDISQFTREKFPIVFNTDMDSRNPIDNIYDVDYEKSIKRLTSFLLQDNSGEIPKSVEEVITVGAPYQNEYVFKQTFEALDAYYDFIRISKAIYIQFAQLKIDIFRSSYTAKEIQKYYNLFMDSFKIIFTSYSSPEQQKTEILRVIDIVIEKYNKYRAEELKYIDTKVVSKKNIFDTSKENYNAIMKVKAGLAAEMVIRIAELCFLIYQGKNPGTPSIFISELKSAKKRVDKELSERTKKIFESIKAALYRKLGKNATKNVNMPNLVNLTNIPSTPAQFTAIFNTALSKIGISIPAISNQSPESRESGKAVLPANLRVKVESIQFWQDLRKLFVNRSILIPVAKLIKNQFNSNEFYLVDIFKSILLNRLMIFKITENGVVNKKFIDTFILNKGYIMMGVNEIELENPVSWRCLNYSNINALLSSEGSFKNIKATRGAFFNLLANNSVLNNLMKVSIPPNSNISIGLKKYCNSIMKNQFASCTILISRNQFAQTVQSQTGTLSGTSGIDLSSGLSYYRRNNVVPNRTKNIVIR